LIDEFQDTSRFQWKNLLPLVINSIANNHQGLIVGDVKQAIYRWRGGDFKLLMEDVNEDLSDYARHLQEEVLPSNWRSRQNVVEFNNAFFETVQQFLDTNPEFPEGKHYIRDAYETVAQQPMREPGGYIRVQFFEGYQEWKDQSKDETLKLIRSLLEDGYSLSDVLILTDTNDLASEIAQKLTEGNIRVVTERSLNVSTSRIVNLFINIFYWMTNPGDQNAIATLTYLYSILKGKPVNHADIRGDAEIAADVFPEGFIEKVPYLKAKPVHELTEELIIRLGLEDKVDIFLQRFMDICLEQAVVGNHDLTSFLRWWEDAGKRREKQRELSVVMPANSEAVQVMTIHKAKGLEAPVV
ncbi:MAG: UvrD-helicase domain-containing protein, partial [Oceanospirillum sp.]|nr:UvrD-helicase domain-containing protein [Oceanospirillum sp.]